MAGGLTLVGSGSRRRAREEFQIIHDRWSYDMVKEYASPGDMQEIDGWARSFYTLEGHLASIRAYDKPLLPQPDDSVWTDVKAEMLNMFSSFETVISLPFETGLDSVRFESSSAAGHGYSGKKGEHDNLKRAKGIANAAIRTYAEMIDQHGINYANDDITSNSTPDIALTRTQLAKLPSIKVRNVFGEAFHYILIEGLTAFPLLEVFKRGDTFYFIGKDPTLEVPYMLESMERRTQWYSVVDWSNFDASVQNWEIDHAFNCLRQMIHFPSRLSELSFEYSIVLFKKRKILSPDGQLYMRDSGIPSGSYFTNMVGSIINYARINFIMKKLNYPVLKIITQGDDSITFIGNTQRPDPSEFSRISERYNWTVKPEKCIITDSPDDVVFLGRSSLHRYNVRDRLKALRLLCFPEFEVEDPKISTARAHAIQRDAGYNDPIFDTIYCALYQMYGEAQDVPYHLLPYFERDLFM
jgi:hypothetical protein